MFLPLSDEPNPRGTPVVNYALIGANLLLFLLVSLPLSLRPPDSADPDLPEYLRLVARELGGGARVEQGLLERVSAYDLYVFRHGFRPARPQAVDLFLSMFLHAGWLHLIGNMLFLWIYGDNVEYRLGRPGYLAAYLATGAAATLFHALVRPGSGLPMIGASGAISGVLGLYFVWFPRNRVRVLMFLFPFSQVILLPARWVLGVYLILDNLLPLLLAPARGGGVAYGAHIGGFFAGLGTAYLWKGWEAARGPAAYRRAAGAGADLPAGGPEPGAARAIEGAGRAVAEYFRLPRARARQEVTSADLLGLADFLRGQGRWDGALLLYQRLLADYPRAPERGRAHLGAGRVQFYGRRQPTAAYQHFLAVLDLDPAADVAAEARTEIERIRHLQKLQWGGGS